MNKPKTIKFPDLGKIATVLVILAAFATVTGSALVFWVEDTINIYLAQENLLIYQGMAMDSLRQAMPDFIIMIPGTSLALFSMGAFLVWTFQSDLNDKHQKIKSKIIKKFIKKNLKYFLIQRIFFLFLLTAAISGKFFHTQSSNSKNLFVFLLLFSLLYSMIIFFNWVASARKSRPFKKSFWLSKANVWFSCIPLGLFATFCLLPIPFANAFSERIAIFLVIAMIFNIQYAGYMGAFSVSREVAQNKMQFIALISVIFIFWALAVSLPLNSFIKNATLNFHIGDYYEKIEPTLSSSPEITAQLTKLNCDKKIGCFVVLNTTTKLLLEGSDGKRLWVLKDVISPISESKNK